MGALKAFVPVALFVPLPSRELTYSSPPPSLLTMAMQIPGYFGAPPIWGLGCRGRFRTAGRSGWTEFCAGRWRGSGGEVDFLVLPRVQLGESEVRHKGIGLRGVAEDPWL